MIRGFGSLNNNSSGEDKPFVEKIKDFWNSIPLMVKSIIVITLVIYTLSWFVSLGILVNFPALTIFNFRIWTLATSCLATLNILNILFAFISWVPSGINDEKEQGSVAYFFYFFMHTIIIQIFFTLTVFLISLIYAPILQYPSAGLWPFIIGELSIRCIKEPDAQMMFFFFPWPIRALYYPWILIGFFTLLNFHIQFDLVVAIVYGYLYHYKLGKYMELSISFIQKMEDCFPFKYIKNFSGFISLVNAHGAAGFTAAAQKNSSSNLPNPDASRDDYAVSYMNNI